MSFTIKGTGFEGSGPGLVRVSGSFAVASSAVVVTGSQKVRPKLGNFTVTRKALGVYVIAYQQAMVSVVSSGAQIGDAAGQSGQAFRTGVGAYTWVSQDFMTVNGAQYLADPTNKLMLILVFNTSNNSLTELPANTRLSFDFCFAQSVQNS